MVGDAFGSTVETGDVNGDGKADVLVGAYAWDGPAGTDQGYVRVFDGATRAQLFELRGDRTTDTFGASIAVADINGDGNGEILVGAPFAERRGTNANTGYVKLFDGATHAQLTWMPNCARSSRSGVCMYSSWFDQGHLAR